MDLPLFIRHLVQQVHSRHPELPLPYAPSLLAYPIAIAIAVATWQKLTHIPAIVLTTWHLGFATLMTQILARFTTVLDSRKKVPMTGKVYLRAIVPIGVMFSLSLICGNVTYLYLSVSFIQMLKVRNIRNTESKIFPSAR